MTTDPKSTARIESLRKHVATTESALSRAREWDEEQGTRASAENLREAKYENSLAVNALRRMEAQQGARR